MEEKQTLKPLRNIKKYKGNNADQVKTCDAGDGKRTLAFDQEIDGRYAFILWSLISYVAFAGVLWICFAFIASRPRDLALLQLICWICSSVAVVPVFSWWIIICVLSFRSCSLVPLSF